MIRKIILGLLLASVSGALIYGGIYRTKARLETENVGEQRDQHQNLPKSQQDNRSPNITRYEDAAGKSGYQGAGNRGLERTGDQLPDEVDEIQLVGAVLDFSADFLRIMTKEGQDVLIENRAWWFAQDMGFLVNIDDQVEIFGFYDEYGVFEVSQITNHTKGITVDIRDVNGRPFWAGGRGGRGQGRRSG